MTRLTKTGLQRFIGAVPDGIFGPKSKALLKEKLTTKNRAPLTEDQHQRAADRLGVPVGHMKGIRKVESPYGAFNSEGQPTNLYERHKFRNNTVPVGSFNKSHPLLSGPPYGPGGYGRLSTQIPKFLDACALDPEAAFRACSWGAFQVLGENWKDLEYESVYAMVMSLVEGEEAHLETFIRYVERNKLVERLRACKPRDAESCRPFVSVYNGPGYAQFNYDVNLANAI